MRLRARALIGAVAVLVGVGCAKSAETVVEGASSTLAQIKTERIVAKAPGTWACRVGRPRPTKGSGGATGTSMEAGTDKLVMTVNADGTYAYVKFDGNGETEYDGDGTWSLKGGDLEVRSSKKASSVNYNISGVDDAATEVFVQRVRLGTPGSVSPDGNLEPLPVEIPDDDHITFDVGRGYKWNCARDATETPATIGPPTTTKR